MKSGNIEGGWSEIRKIQVRKRGGEASQTVRAKIGIVGVHSGGSEGFLQALFPEEVQVDHVGLGVLPEDWSAGSLYNLLKGVKGVYLSRVPELVAEHRWHGVCIAGTALELLNPGLLQDLQARLDILVTTWVESCIVAIKSLSVQRVLVITSYDEGLDKMLRDRFANSGIEAVLPASKPFLNLAERSKPSAEDVLLFTKQAFEGAKGVQAIYFQSSRNRVPMLERIEQELNTTVVSPWVAPLWYLLSRLGLSYHIRGGGRLLREWCKLPEG